MKYEASSLPRGFVFFNSTPKVGKSYQTAKYQKKNIQNSISKK